MKYKIGELVVMNNTHANKTRAGSIVYIEDIDDNKYMVENPRTGVYWSFDDSDIDHDKTMVRREYENALAKEKESTKLLKHLESQYEIAKQLLDNQKAVVNADREDLNRLNYII